MREGRNVGDVAVIPIDIDEDVNSSLNTLLDTRHDSEDSQVRTMDQSDVNIYIGSPSSRKPTFRQRLL